MLRRNAKRGREEVRGDRKDADDVPAMSPDFNKLVPGGDWLQSPNEIANVRPSPTKKPTISSKVTSELADESMRTEDPATSKPGVQISIPSKPSESEPRGRLSERFLASDAKNPAEFLINLGNLAEGQQEQSKSKAQKKAKPKAKATSKTPPVASDPRPSATPSARPPQPEQESEQYAETIEQLVRDNEQLGARIRFLEAEMLGIAHDTAEYKIFPDDSTILDGTVHWSEPVKQRLREMLQDWKDAKEAKKAIKDQFEQRIERQHKQIDELQKEIERLTEANTKFKQDLTTANRELESKKERVTELDSELKSVKDERSTLKVQLASANTKVEGLENKEQEQAKQLRDLETKVEQAKQKLNAAERDHAAAQASLTTAKTEAENSVGKLQNELKSSKSAAARMQSELDEAKRELAKARTENNGLVEEKRELDDKVSDLNSRLQASEQTVETKQHDLDTAKEEAKKFESLHKQLKAKRDEQKKLIEEVKAEKNKAEEARAGWKQKFDEVSRQLAAKEEELRVLGEEKTSNQQLNAKQQAKLKRLEALEELPAKVAELESEIEKLKAAKVDLEREKKAVEAAANRELEAKEEAKKRLQESIDKLIEERDRLAKELKQASDNGEDERKRNKKEHDDYDQKLTAWQKASGFTAPDDVKSELEKHARELAELKGRFTTFGDLTKTNTDLKAANAELTSQLASLNKFVLELQMKATVKEAEHTAQQRLDATKYSELQTEYAKNLAAAQADIETFKGEIASLNVRLTNKTDALAIEGRKTGQLAFEKQNLASELVAANEKAAHLQSVIEKFQQLVGFLQQTLESKEKVMAERLEALNNAAGLALGAERSAFSTAYNDLEAKLKAAMTAAATTSAGGDGDGGDGDKDKSAKDDKRPSTAIALPTGTAHFLHFNGDNGAEVNNQQARELLLQFQLIRARLHRSLLDIEMEPAKRRCWQRVTSMIATDRYWATVMERMLLPNYYDNRLPLSEQMQFWALNKGVEPKHFARQAVLTMIWFYYKFHERLDQTPRDTDWPFAAVHFRSISDVDNIIIDKFEPPRDIFNVLVDNLSRVEMELNDSENALRQSVSFYWFWPNTDRKTLQDKSESLAMTKSTQPYRKDAVFGNHRMAWLQHGTYARRARLLCGTRWDHERSVWDNLSVVFKDQSFPPILVDFFMQQFELKTPTAARDFWGTVCP